MKRLSINKIHSVEILKLNGNVIEVKVIYNVYDVVMYTEYEAKPGKAINYNKIPACVWKFVSQHREINMTSSSMRYNGYEKTKYE